MKINSEKFVLEILCICGITSAATKYEDLETAEQTLFIPPLVSQFLNVARSISGYPINGGYYSSNGLINGGYNQGMGSFNRGYNNRFYAGPYNNFHSGYRRYSGGGYNGIYYGGSNTNVFAGDTVINDVETRIGDQNYDINNNNDASSSSNFFEGSEGQYASSDCSSPDYGAGDNSGSDGGADTASDYGQMDYDSVGDQSEPASDYDSAVDSEDTVDYESDSL